MSSGKPVSPAALSAAFGNPPSSSAVTSFLSTLSGSPVQPVIKSYPDATFHSYHPLGFDLVYHPSTSQTAQSSTAGQLVLDTIDLYNPLPPPPAPTTSSRTKRSGPIYSTPSLPITFHFPGSTLTLPPPKPGGSSREISRPKSLEVGQHTTGREFVSAFGEPSKKGGGTGWVPPFLEWSRVEILGEDDETDGSAVGGEAEEGHTGRRTVVIGVMVELSHPGPGEKMTEEQKLKGMGGVWDRAAGWEWSNLKIFRPDPKDT
ncbi:hypothetical protein JCM24511_00643 [Saitozyma sp. JCM 24511]|nr:hypothetical protein JCM24511_00643 [Saitozyma sp. JCM 24511]